MAKNAKKPTAEPTPTFPAHGLHHAPDAIDLRILELLQNDGRLSNVDLAKAVGLTPAPTLERVRKLESAGYIRGYAAHLDGAALGCGTTAFVSVVLQSHRLDTSVRFREACERLPEVLECHHIAGEEDFLLKVVTAGPAEYERFVLETLTRVTGIEKVKTTFVLSTSKMTTALPLRGSAPQPVNSPRRPVPRRRS